MATPKMREPLRDLDMEQCVPICDREWAWWREVVALRGP